MIKVGLTGNIASGKSEVERILKELGYLVICADEIVHRLYEDNEIKNLIMEKFGTTDRVELARMIFADAAKKKELEDILHPRVVKEIEKFFAENAGKNLVFASVPLIYEAGLEKLFDNVVLIVADNKTREKRLMARDDISQEFAELKMASQIPQEEKIKRADFVVENNGTAKNLEEEVISLVRHLSSSCS